MNCIKGLYAGTASFDMSPPPGVLLAGYSRPVRNNTGVHDPLVCSCLYLQRGEVEIAVVTLDILYFSKQYAARVRACAQKACGIPEHNILICCSHTHSGPWAAGNPELSGIPDGIDDIDPDYLNFLLDGICRTVSQAKFGRFKASIGFGTAVCGAEQGVGGSRRSPEGLCDPQVCVMAVSDFTRKIRYVLVNYALHPTFLHEDNLLVSADYPAYIREKIQERYPDAVFGFSQGTSGDQSSRYFRAGQSFDEAKRVGGAIGHAAIHAVETMSFDKAPSLKADYREIPLALREYPPVRSLEAAARLKREKYEALRGQGAPYVEIQEAKVRMQGAEAMLSCAGWVSKGLKIKLRDMENPAEVMAVKIGSNYIVGLPGEVFVCFGLKIKREAGVPVFVFELANGCLPGYCCDREAYGEDGYEAGTSMLAPDFGDQLADAALKLIRDLK